MTKSEKRRLLSLCETGNDGVVLAHRIISDFDLHGLQKGKLVTRKSELREAERRKDEKRKKLRSENRATREVCVVRSNTFCEFVRYDLGWRCPKPYNEMDHFWGRAKDRTPAGCWMLCREHHYQKTLNQPSRRYWLKRFHEHLTWHLKHSSAAMVTAAWRQHLSAAVERARVAIQLEEAQHPGSTNQE